MHHILMITIFWFVPMVNPDGNWMAMRKAMASSFGYKMVETQKEVVKDVPLKDQSL